MATVRREARTAKAYWTAARRVASPDVALSMLDVAVPAALASVHAARASHEPFDARGEISWLAAEDAVPGRAVTAFDERASARERTFAEKEAIRDGIEELVACVLARVERRSVAELRALRYGRIAAVLLAFALLVEHTLRSTVLVHDVALHKPVTSSPLKITPPTADEVVDGKTRGTFGIHTITNPHAFVTVDLLRTYDVREVRVYNRGDGWFDDVLPLTLSVSVDGSTFAEVATRTTHFDVWSVDLHGRPARWVRVSNDTYIALNEIEVYARE